MAVSSTRTHAQKSVLGVADNPGGAALRGLRVAADGSGAVVGQQGGHEVAGGDGPRGEGDRGWNAAPVWHPRLVEGPGGPQPEREDDGGGCGTHRALPAVCRPPPS